MPCVALVCVVVFPPWAGVWAWMAPLPDTVQEQVDDAVGHGLDGIIVYVDRADRSPVLYAAGWKNRAEQAPADPHALFKIASISKLYIAAAAAKLVAGRQLSLDATLADYLPGLAGRIENAERITLGMLLRHRSGIPNFTDQEAFDWAKPPPENGDKLALVLDKPADFAPDADYRYSNTNYLLVGAILDDMLGYSHREYINREILDPLDLFLTYGLFGETDPGDVVSGYHHPYQADFKEVDFVAPGGSMVATAQDVGVFLRALNDGSLLTKGEQAVYSSIYQYEHTGWLLGYYSIARYHRDVDAVVIQFVNTTGDEKELVANVVYDRIVRILGKE